MIGAEQKESILKDSGMCMHGNFSGTCEKCKENKLLEAKANSNKETKEVPATPDRGLMMDETAWREFTKEADPKETDKLANEFGIEPYRRLGYHKYEEFNRDVLGATKKLNARIEKINLKQGTSYPPIREGLIAATILQEGLAAGIDYAGYKTGGYQYDSFGDIGMDAIGGEMQSLKRIGLLEKDLGEPITTHSTKEQIFVKNEAGMEAALRKMSGAEAVEGIGAMLLARRNKLIDKMGREKWDSYTEPEQSWLTYASYNWGEGNVDRLVEQNVVSIRPAAGSKAKRIPITEYDRSVDGKPGGKVADLKSFIHKDHGLRLRGSNIDFHKNASQVAVSAELSGKFFEWLKKKEATKGTR